MKQPDKVREVLARVKDTLDKLSASAFDASEKIHTRAYWDNWYKTATSLDK
jgi:hypothetical protein